MIYFTADLHFGHNNILKLCNRPFKSIDEMDETLINNWNNKVKNNDTVYILGDLIWERCDPLKYLDKLHGKKVLIMGNHDKKWILNLYKKLNLNKDVDFKKLIELGYFQNISSYYEDSFYNHTITFCHYPMIEWKSSRKLGSKKLGFLIHGHIHNNYKDEYKFLFRSFNTLNAGVDINNYSPVNFDELIKNNEIYKLSKIEDPLDKALFLADKYHYGQVDKAGIPYIEHPKFVSSCVNTLEEKIVALLHDILEDTNIDLKILEDNFSNDIVNAIKTMTHKNEESYFEYIERIKLNPIAKQVKIADLNHNMDLSRLKKITPNDLERVEKYNKALEILKK